MRLFPGTKAKREILLQAKPSPTKLVSVARALDTAIKSMDPTWDLFMIFAVFGTSDSSVWYS